MSSVYMKFEGCLKIEDSEKGMAAYDAFVEMIKQSGGTIMDDRVEVAGDKLRVLREFGWETHKESELINIVREMASTEPEEATDYDCLAAIYEVLEKKELHGDDLQKVWEQVSVFGLPNADDVLDQDGEIATRLDKVFEILGIVFN